MKINLPPAFSQVVRGYGLVSVAHSAADPLEDKTAYVFLPEGVWILAQAGVPANRFSFVGWRTSAAQSRVSINRRRTVP